MRNYIYIIIAFYSCSSVNKSHDTYQIDQKENYFVSKIDSINNYYLIYAERNDTIFKIVSKKSKNFKECNKVEQQNKYKFSLVSYRENAFKINGVSTIPLNVQGFGVDEDTFIMLEGEKGIFDIYFPTNVEGLCIKK